MLTHCTKPGNVAQFSGLYYFQPFPAVTTFGRDTVRVRVRVSTDCGRGVFRGRPLRLPLPPFESEKKLTVVVPLMHLRHVAPQTVFKYCLMFHFLKSS